MHRINRSEKKRQNIVFFLGIQFKKFFLARKCIHSKKKEHKLVHENCGLTIDPGVFIVGIYRVGFMASSIKKRSKKEEKREKELIKHIDRHFQKDNGYFAEVSN